MPEDDRILESIKLTMTKHSERGEKMWDREYVVKNWDDLVEAIKNHRGVGEVTMQLSEAEFDG